MHFLPTDDQLELQRGVRNLLDDRYPLDKLAGGYDADLWRSLVETGVFSLRTDLALGLADAVLVFEELGRAAVPGPLVATLLASELDGVDDTGPTTWVDVTDEPTLFVTHLDIAASVLVITGTDVRLAAAPPIQATPVPTPVDPLSPVHELRDVPAGDVVGDSATAQRLRRDGAVLTAAVQVGLAARMTELAVAYAKEREQFGRAIGSFQAVKHLCADMFVRTELARVAVHAAAVTVDDPGSTDAGRAVAGAKLLADEAATANGRSAVQVHGGMGFTWEVPVHYFLKRAWVHATEFGTADDHAEDLAELL
jgi:alkylation response protein AidB-like acyl-CoA dehydrogenase